MTELPGRPAKSEIILYQTEDGKTRVQVRIQGDTVWLPLNQMVELFQRVKSVAGKTNQVHIGRQAPGGALTAQMTGRPA